MRRALSGGPLRNLQCHDCSRPGGVEKPPCVCLSLFEVKFGSHKQNRSRSVHLLSSPQNTCGEMREPGVRLAAANGWPEWVDEPPAGTMKERSVFRPPPGRPTAVQFPVGGMSLVALFAHQPTSTMSLRTPPSTQPRVGYTTARLLGGPSRARRRGRVPLPFFFPFLKAGAVGEWRTYASGCVDGENPLPKGDSKDPIHQPPV
jgi:hypothetical protein